MPKTKYAQELAGKIARDHFTRVQVLTSTCLFRLAAGGIILLLLYRSPGGKTNGERTRYYEEGNKPGDDPVFILHVSWFLDVQRTPFGGTKVEREMLQNW